MVDGEDAGEVDDVLVDDAGSVQYLDVDLGALRKHVLIPLENARPDELERRVWVPGMTRQQLRDVPAYEHDVGTVTEEYRQRVSALYAGYAAGEAPSREERRAARPVAERTEAPEYLASLKELTDYQVAEGDPDPRGWEVIGGDGERIGRVHELLVDTAAMKVRYLDCDVDARLRPDGETRHVLIPIGYARLDQDGKRITVDVISSEDVRGLPAYDGGRVTRAYEEEVEARYAAHRRAVDDASGAGGERG